MFSKNTETLQNIIANYQNKTTWAARSYFDDVSKHLTSASSLLMVFNPDAMQNLLIKNGFENTDYKLDEYKASALQFVFDNNFAHVNGVLKESSSTGELNSINEVFNIKLENDLLTNPQFVTNHITKLF